MLNEYDMTLYRFSAMILASPDMWAAFIAHEWERRTGHTHPPPPWPEDGPEGAIENALSEALDDVWFDIVDESEEMEEEAGGVPIFFGPQPPPALFHWEAPGHNVPPVFPTGFIPAHEEFQIDDLLWDGAFIILSRDPVPEPRDVDGLSGPFWAPPPVFPRVHLFPRHFPMTRDEDDRAEHQRLDPIDNLLLDRPPWVADPPPAPQPPQATMHDVRRMIETAPALPPPGWQTLLTLLRPHFHEAPWRLEPAMNIPEHIVRPDDLEMWANRAAEVLIRRNRTLMQLILFDVQEAVAGADAIHLAGAM